MYVDLYSGPDYPIYVKFGVNCFVMYLTMMYSLGMPLLFPVGALTFAVVWILERIMVCYVCVLPPAMDDTLVKNSVKMFRWAALIYLFVGYWMISNPKYFDNEVFPIEMVGDVQKTEHIAFNSLILEQAAPLFIIGIILLIILLIQKKFGSKLRKYGFAFNDRVLKVDEDLPRFWDALRFKNAAWLFHEVRHMKEKYGFSFVDDQIS